MTLARKASAVVLTSLLAVAAAGCSDDDDSNAPTAPPTTSAAASPVATTASPTPSPTSSASASPTARPSRVPPPVGRPSPTPSLAGDVSVVLSASGVGFASGASIQQVPFGSGVGTITTALTTALGRGKTRTLADCGQGPRTQVDFSGFTILLDSGRFVGWTESGSPERDLSTANGIALQVTLAEVRQALPDAKVSNGSLGPEFSSKAGVSGFLDGTTAQSRVTQLYSGETCFFR